ncbi:MAG: hypothetical protein OXF26_05475, partial [Alphaproteobacteria bacterium]|nr:hypothetical protein [Alphaproteobacteria bacterium]
LPFGPDDNSGQCRLPLRNAILVPDDESASCLQFSQALDQLHVFPLAPTEDSSSVAFHVTPMLLLFGAPFRHRSAP